MADMMVKLYELPTAQQISGVTVRVARSYEKFDVVEWVNEKFGHEWASECDVAFSNTPISCFIATENGKILGFACYDCTSKAFFGPTGVDESRRGRGIGKALLLACLQAMRENGYAYAIIGGIGPAEFYRETVGAVEIEGSTPGIYFDRLKKK